MLQQPYCHYTQRLLDKLIALNEKAKDKIDLEQIKKAIWYAITYHGEQKRDSGEPFYSHPLEVAYMVSDYLFKTDAIIISVLHDTIEDTQLTRKMIAEEFGEKIADGVYDLTRIKEDGIKISVAEMMNKLYIAKNNDLLTIKLFDRLHNIITIGSKSAAKKQSIIDQSITHFIPITMLYYYKEVEEKIINSIYSTLLSSNTDVLCPKQFSFVDSDQILSRAWQNDTNQISMLMLQES